MNVSSFNKQLRFFYSVTSAQCMQSAETLRANSIKIGAAFTLLAIASPSALAAFPCPTTTTTGDSTASWCTTPNFPVSDKLPKSLIAAPGNGLQLTTGAKNEFSMIMGVAQLGANMITSQSIRDRFYFNYITGNLNATIGSPMDTGQSNNNTFAAVARHYNIGDPNDLHVMESDGMHLSAICSENHTDCSPGKVWAAMVRLPSEIRPGMTIKVRYKSPSGNHSWAPIWLFQGIEHTPGAAMSQDPSPNPYAGYGTPLSLVQFSSVGLEVDMNDNYSRFSQGVETGYQLDYGTPNIYGAPWKVAPHMVFWANSAGYEWHENAGPDFDQLPMNWSTGFHNLVLSWDDKTNLLFEFVDGVLTAESYMEYPASTYVDGFHGYAVRKVAMNLIISNQAIPAFSPGASTATDNDGIKDGWTIVVQEVSAWQGTVVNPLSYAPSGSSFNSNPSE